MGTVTQHLHRRIGRVLIYALLGGAFAVSIAGCVTQQQVRDIVDASNAQIADELAAPGLAAKPGETADAASKIDEFIAAHPDQKALNSSLRIRQGVLYLNKGQYNLAQAAFDEADASQLFTDRDRALKSISPHLVWWFKNSARDPSEIPADEFKRALDALKTEVTARSASPGIRDYLAELRAWIGLQYARGAVSAQEGKARLEDALNEYATVFTPADLAAVCKPSSAGGQAGVQDVRRRLRAEAVLASARDLTDALKRGGAEPSLKAPEFQALIQGSPTCDKRADAAQRFFGAAEMRAPGRGSAGASSLPGRAAPAARAGLPGSLAKQSPQSALSLAAGQFEVGFPVHIL